MLNSLLKWSATFTERDDKNIQKSPWIVLYMYINEGANNDVLHGYAEPLLFWREYFSINPLRKKLFISVSDSISIYISSRSVFLLYYFMSKNKLIFSTKIRNTWINWAPLYHRQRLTWWVFFFFELYLPQFRFFCIRT